MIQPRVVVHLDNSRREYQPGDTVSGEFRIDVVNRWDIRAMEVSVLWFTEGKGDEDLQVHYFYRLSADDGDYINPFRPGRFSTRLPNSPLSYEGVIVKIRWCARVRLFLPQGKEVADESIFWVGQIPPARAVLP